MRCTMLHGSSSNSGEPAMPAMCRTIRALYAHSYVDRLWNLAATERRQMGLRCDPQEMLEFSTSGRLLEALPPFPEAALLRLVQGDWIDDPAQPGTFRPGSLRCFYAEKRTLCPG